MSESLDAIVAEQMARWTVPGVTVGILRDGKRSLHAWGVTSLETGQPARPDTLFQIGSISKVFCATLVML
ncbi:MAG TPA: serine hydrolase domain-containing protein, partial [Thermomicrobiales bacterium]|nr:serine hydrolase domain-containing protein [Thermomicrobiales bacterium]